MEKERTCAQHVDDALRGRIEDLKELWEKYQKGEDEPEIYEYGLAFDYVAPDTFREQPEGYFRYQISWGGPSDEFRFFTNPNFSVHRIEYWFMDWGDGACRVLPYGDADFVLIKEIYDNLFLESGTAEHAYHKAVEDA